MKAKGRVHKFGDDINTDEIIPAKFLNTSDAAELASHCMEGISDAAAKSLNKGDIIVGGRNFGCGSSREHAPYSIKMRGIPCVIAESFARIFYRNSINIGLPILESPEASKAIGDGDIIEADFINGDIRNISKNEVYKAQRFPQFMQELIEAGGLIKWIKKGKGK